MRYISLVFCLATGVALAAPVPVPPQSPKSARTPIGPGYEPTQFDGRVEYLATEKITVKPEGHLRVDITWLTPEGVREERYYEQDNSQPNRVFAFTDRLLTIHGVRLPANRVWEGSRNRGEHNIADIRIGDLVHISYQTARGEAWCSFITVLRRPGGRVPDAYGDDDPAYKMKVSTERNFSQFTEETIAGKWGPRLLSAFRRR